jgi:hypothetical protein
MDISSKKWMVECSKRHDKVSDRSKNCKNDLTCSEWDFCQDLTLSISITCLQHGAEEESATDYPMNR